ncbi:MAG: putative metal-binding motif-containing protein, partial [Myxococcota bacterium]|nr:putative metal-binding motif-containing protein [Myxococcota bacterium]
LEVDDGWVTDSDEVVISVDATTTWYIDYDSDGYGSDRYTEVSCEQPSGYVDNDADCDDAEEASSPGEVEVCDELDNDCDGFTDEDATDAGTFYADSDGDGFGDPERPYEDCEQPTGYVTDDTDCDDGKSGVNPEATELCATAYDDDCNDDDNEVDAEGCSDFHLDEDGDGYGTKESVCLCTGEES